MDYVPDTSVIVDGRFTTFVKEKRGCRVILSEAMLSEVEHQANDGRSIGFAALEELRKLRELENSGYIYLEFTGERPQEWQRRGGKSGEIDEIIRSVAASNNATLVTGDQIQREIAEIKGIEVMYLEPPSGEPRNIEEFFDPETSSVHLKTGVEVLTKSGPPGAVHLKGAGVTLTEQEMEMIANHIVKRGRNEPGSFIEVDSHGATVIQLGNMRIVITRPPFSDEIEITAVRPVRKLSIGDYSISSELLTRLEDQARGILISGGPGEGKSTFVQALAEHLSAKGHIVKTMERPRDLQVEKRITQYTALEGSMEKTGDILLLVREDYTVFDEMRVTSDFLVYSDLRMAGVGMIGVVHATRAIDSIQRFINRIELGMIPQVIDTIIFIESGKISQVLITRYSVKVPSGMKEEDLARPVIEILDFQTNKPVFEIYTFGEQIVVVPVSHEKEPNGLMKIAQEKIYSDLSKMLGTSKIKVTLHGEGKALVNVPEDLMSRVIGKKGATVNELEKKFGLHLDIEPLSGEYYQERRIAGIDIKNKIIYLNVEVPNQQVKFYVDNILILQARSSGKGIVRIKIQSDTGSALYNYIKAGKSVEYSVSQ